MSGTILHTGGTIGSAGTPLTPLPGDVFADRWARLMGTMPIPLTLDPPLDSADATPADWVRLTRAALAVEEPLLILHGTDTMPWSAAALAFLSISWDSSGEMAGRRAAPLVLTGSQLPLLTADTQSLRDGSDAAANIGGGLAALKDAGRGTHVFFHGHLTPGPRTVKRHSLDPDAFAMPNGPAPLPPAPPAPADRLLRQLDRLAPHVGTRAVIPFFAMPNAPEHAAAQLDAVAGIPGLGAVILMGYGTGNIPAETHLAPRIASLVARGVLVVITTQLPAGPAESTTYTAGSWLAEAGVLPSGDRTLPAIGAKLHILLALAAVHGWSSAQTARLFAMNHAGEGAA